MVDPANHLVVGPPPSSPTISSVSSSDLDTESTGSFFHDTSTTLGTLMGVTLQAITFRESSRNLQQESCVAAASGGRRYKRREAAARRRRRGRSWWRLCRDEVQSRRASLGDFLEVERRFGNGSVAAIELEEGLVRDAPRHGRVLFADGRVLPPAAERDDDTSPAAGGGVCRFAGVERCCRLVL